MAIDILAPDDQRVNRFLDRFFSGQFPELTAVGAILFGGDRLTYVEAVALLSVGGVDGGLATLAPTDEMGYGGPSIIALWLDPEVRASRNYRTHALALFRALAEESVTRYGVPARFVTGTRTERQVALWAQEEGIPFTHVPVQGQLPDW